MTTDLREVFETLKPILAECSSQLLVTADDDQSYALASTSAVPKNHGETLFFGSIKTGKSYVSFHLMPIYTNPDLLDDMSDILKKRMQGKSCFNFKTNPSPELVDELRQIAQRSLETRTSKS
jgi:hypothetical protein